MTANKYFKRRVRERARRTGESYTAALRNLRHASRQEQTMTMDDAAARPHEFAAGPAPREWQRVEVPEFGYALQVPSGWQRRDADLRNSPWETARFCDPPTGGTP